MTTPPIGDPRQIGFTTGNVSPIWQGFSGSEPVCLYNQDKVNTVTVGFSLGFNITDTNTIPLLPLQSMVIAGDRAIFGRAITGTVPLLVIPGGAQFMNGNVSISGPVTAVISGPVSIQTLAPIDVSAANVNVIPLSGPVNLIQLNQFTVNAGSSTTVPNQTFTQSAYEIYINPWQTTAGVAGPLEIQMKWYESNGTTLVDQQTWYCWPGSAPLGASIAGHGPAKASILSIVFVNHSTGLQVYTINVSLFQRSHYYTKDDWRGQTIFNTVSGETIPTNDPDGTLLGYRNLSVGIGASDTSLLPLYCGPAILYADTNSNTTDMTVTLVNNSNPNGETLGAYFYRVQSGATGLITANIALPRYQTTVVMSNGNAAAKVLRYSIHTIEAV